MPILTIVATHLALGFSPLSDTTGDALPTQTNVSGELPNPLNISTVGELIDKLTNALTLVAVPVVTGMVMWGAFKIITSGSNPKGLAEGGKIIGYAALGFCLLLIADGITNIILSLFK